LRLAVGVDQNADKSLGQKMDIGVAKCGVFHLVTVGAPLGREEQQTRQALPGSHLAAHGGVEHKVQTAMPLDQARGNFLQCQRHGVVN
jgi:hypothetical protein